MGQMIGGIYMPSYADILKERFALQQAIDAKKAAAEEQTYQRGITERKLQMEEQKMGMEKERMGLEKAESKAKLDYYKALEVKALAEANKGKDKKIPEPRELEAFAKLLLSGFLKQAEEYGKQIGFLEADSVLSQGEGGNITVISSAGNVDITPEGLMFMAGIKTKEDAKDFVKERDDAISTVSKLVDDRAQDIARVNEQARKMAEEESEFSTEDASFAAEQFKAQKIKEIDDRYKSKFQLDIMKKGGYSDSTKAMASATFDSYTIPVKTVSGAPKVQPSPGEVAKPGKAPEMPKNTVVTPRTEKQKASLESYLSRSAGE